MELKVLRKNLLLHKTPCLVIGRFEGRGENASLEEVDKALEGLLSHAVKSGDFKGKLKQTALFYTNGRISAERVLLIGLGNRREFSTEKLREVAGTAAGLVKKSLKVKSFSLALPDLPEGDLPPAEGAQAAVEGTLLALYAFDEYKTEKKELSRPVAGFTLVYPLRYRRIKVAEAAAHKAKEIVDAVRFARDLISRPGNVATPTHIAEEAVRMAKGLGIKATVLEKKEMEELGMGALLGVAQGSAQPPKFIILEYYGGQKGEKPVVVVGKAITFDSGGISIKPSNGMEEMKTDMSGGAAALGALMAAASLKLHLNLVALVPATENLPGGRAYKPGDILKSMSGQTIEVVNTDAEGRLILADALTYAERFEPKAVVDLATLTGACVVALGSHASGLLGNNEGLKKALIRAGEETGERLWELPLWEPYKKQIKSDVADMKNSGGREAGTITAAAFLERFAHKYHWAHIDIAGTAWHSKGKAYIPKGAVGVGVRLLVRFFENGL